MNKWLLYLAFPAIILFTACVGDRAAVTEDVATKMEPSIFNFSRAFTPEEFNVSFPLWFNDSLIRKHGIHTIVRKLYSNSMEMDTAMRSLRELKRYTFDKDGKLTELYIEHYYDHSLIGSMNFTLEQQDEYGFAIAKWRKGILAMADEEILNQYRVYVKQKYAKKFLAYEEITTGDYLFFMLNKNHWGPLSVDSILHPVRHDMVVLGTPNQPHKRYRVENRVNEHDVIQYSYEKDLVKHVSFDKYPFHYERSLTFGPKGMCTGFIDSTFINAKYLTRRESVFQMQKELPIELLHKNKASGSSTAYYQMETFEYTYFLQK